MSELSIDPARVYIAGVSAGAAMALTVMYSNPDLYAAIGVHSGVAYGAAASIADGMKAMGAGATAPEGLGAAAVRAMGDRARPIAAIVFHGGADAVVKAVNAAQVVSQLQDANSRTGKSNRGAIPAAAPTVTRGNTSAGYHYSRELSGNGRWVVERWIVDELGHAWSGGSPDGTYTDAKGPDATAEMIRFFLEHPQRQARN